MIVKTVSPNFDFDDQKTWDISTYPGIFGKSMYLFNGFGQSNFSWFLRTHPNILEIYSKLLKTRDLITSLDGFSLVVSNKQQSKSWHHVDQNPQNDILSYQASYNYFKVDENDAGFVIAPKSHLEFKPEVSHKRNWIKVPIDGVE